MISKKQRMGQKKYHLPVTLLVPVILFCLSIFMMGCSFNKTISSPVSETESENLDCVLLKNVEPPHFLERFAILYSGSDSTNINWGYSDDSITQGYFWTTSSYPGFKYTILVQYDFFKFTDNVKLKTKYGEYQYAFDQKYPVFVENGELVNQSSGEKVNKLDANQEHLVIYSSVKKEAYEYILTKGTEIKIE